MAPAAEEGRRCAHDDLLDDPEAGPVWVSDQLMQMGEIVFLEEIFSLAEELEEVFLALGKGG